MSGRIRTIKPEWLEDEALAASGDASRILSIALILLADDHGRGRGSDRYIAAQVWSYDENHLAKAREALANLREIGFVRTYDVAGQRYYEIRNWSKHQRVDKPGKPRVPPPPPDVPPFASNPGTFPGSSRLTTIYDHDHDPEKDPDPDRDRERDLRAREDSPPELNPPPWLVVAAAYKLRWERDRGTPFPHDGHHRSLDIIGRWAEEAAQMAELPFRLVVDTLLDAYWVDEWAVEMGWPLAHLSRYPGKYYAPIETSVDREHLLKMAERTRLIACSQQLTEAQMRTDARFGGKTAAEWCALAGIPWDASKYHPQEARDGE